MGVIKNEAYCDICGKFHCRYSAFDLEYSGYGSGQPKFKIECNICKRKINDRIISSIFGYVPDNVRLEENDLVELEAEIERDNMSETVKNTKNTLTVEQLNAKINWNDIDQLINDNKCRVAQLATELNANPAELRKIFIDHYGDKIVFVRGRNGGVRWNKENA